MNLYSMTGYGQGEAALDGRRATLTLRSVNHRHLDVRCRVPSGLVSIEARLRARIRAVLGRGKVDVSLQIQGSAGGEAQAPATVDVAAALAYWEQIVVLSEALGIPAPQPDPALLLGLPEVVQAAPISGDPDDVWEQLLPAVDAALGQLLDSRRAEGASLVRDLSGRLERLGELHVAARARAPEAVEHQQRRLRRRVETLLVEHGVQLDEGRLAQELALLSDRADVEEELTRLDHHLDTLGRLVVGDGSAAVGRKLDFVLQEAMREANTLGSKANDAPLADVVVEIKAELERVREQVQNLE